VNNFRGRFSILFLLCEQSYFGHVLPHGRIFVNMHIAMLIILVVGLLGTLVTGCSRTSGIAVFITQQAEKCEAASKPVRLFAEMCQLFVR
jgi:hypothetical protein